MEKVTFIFDFDDTIYGIPKTASFYHENIRRNSLTSGYICPIMYHNLKGNYSDLKEYWRFVEESYVNFPEYKDFVKVMFDTYYKHVTKYDVNYAIKEILNYITADLLYFIKKIQHAGHEIFVIGGWIFGGVVIPGVVNQFGINDDHIFSGFFRHYKNEDFAEGFLKEFRYANAQNPFVHTPYSGLKSCIVKHLKNNGTIKGKTILIGDGENDLEVYTSGVVDEYIGFGGHFIREKVKQGAPKFAYSMQECIKICNKYL